jgi:DNA-binding transcriptional LysR family regulator
MIFGIQVHNTFWFLVYLHNMNAFPRHLDVQLVRTLYLLLSERSVTRVALKLNKPQPTISSALRKLRELTGDALLVRGHSGYVLTQHATTLLQRAEIISNDLDFLFGQRATFSPATEGREFHIGAPDYLDSRLLPNIVASIRRYSPNSRVTIHSLGPDVDYAKQLANAKLDLVVANWDCPPLHLHFTILIEDPLACYMREDCAYALRTESNAMTVDDYLTLPHVVPCQILAGQPNEVDRHLASKDLRRNVVAQCAYFAQIPYLLTRSDLVLTTGRQFMALYEATLPIKSYMLPIELPRLRFYQLWHERAHHSAEHKWLRELVARTANELVERKLKPPIGSQSTL